MAIPLFEPLVFDDMVFDDMVFDSMVFVDMVLDSMVITADALLTQRDFARYLVEEKHAHYHFTVKANQATLLDDIALFFQDRQSFRIASLSGSPVFQDRQEPDAVIIDSGHGRIETRWIWVTSPAQHLSELPSR